MLNTRIYKMQLRDDDLEEKNQIQVTDQKTETRRASRSTKNSCRTVQSELVLSLAHKPTENEQTIKKISINEIPENDLDSLERNSVLIYKQNQNKSNSKNSIDEEDRQIPGHMEPIRQLYQQYLVSKHKKQENLKNSTQFKTRNIEIFWTPPNKVSAKDKCIIF